MADYERVIWNKTSHFARAMERVLYLYNENIFTIALINILVRSTLPLDLAVLHAVIRLLSFTDSLTTYISVYLHINLSLQLLIFLQFYPFSN